MVLPHSTFVQMNNPYAKAPAVADSANYYIANFTTANDELQNSNMGVRSDLRNGAIKGCKKKATAAKCKRLYTQTAVGGGIAFVPHLHCRVCKRKREIMQQKSTSPLKRAHHVRCPLNRTTRGTSAQSVFVNRESERNVAINTAPVGSVLGKKIAAESGTSVAQFFAPTRPTTVPYNSLFTL